MRRIALGSLPLVLVLLVGCPAGENPAAQQTKRQTGSPNAPRGAASCSSRPVPLRRPDVRAVAFARGEGPVYVGLGAAGPVRYTEDNRQHEGWYYHKTLWAVAPAYEGSLTISGHQLDGPNLLRFSTGPGFPGAKLMELSMPSDGSGGWRYGPSDTLIRALGCYTFEVEGEGFRQFITFKAVD